MERDGRHLWLGCILGHLEGKPKASEQAATRDQPRRVSGAKQNKQHALALTLVAAHRQPPPSGYHHSTTTSNIALTARQRRVKISQGGLL